ncbi:MAG: hypothetical protein C1O27_001388 [Chloroflexi bacterium]|jgi:hypothetical protein|nr:MAG: hypothetical protein C1O27_001388 [Chloroflexota bacterium]
MTVLLCLFKAVHILIEGRSCGQPKVKDFGAKT